MFLRTKNSVLFCRQLLHAMNQFFLKVSNEEKFVELLMLLIS